jgi:hypothetical protein
MLFKIANLIILADDESEARRIFTEATGLSSDNHITQILLSEGRRYMTANLLSQTDSMYRTCISCIDDKYQDTDGAIQEITKHIDTLNDYEMSGIFQSLLVSEYNETKPMLTLINAMDTIPSDWISEIQKHVSKFWIGIDAYGDYCLDQNNLKLLQTISSQAPPVIQQLSEAERYLERLNGTLSSVKRLVNSVNFSYDALFEFSEECPEYSWILDHYEYKQKLIRDGHVMISNDVDIDIDSD